MGSPLANRSLNGEDGDDAPADDGWAGVGGGPADAVCAGGASKDVTGAAEDRKSAPVETPDVCSGTGGAPIPGSDKDDGFGSLETSSELLPSEFSSSCSAMMIN